MANNRRNSNGGNDDFDWEAYDKMTSDSPAAPRRRRASNDRKRNTNIQSGIPDDSGSQTPTRRAPSKRKRKKKVLTEKQKRFRRRLRLTIFSILFIGIIVVTGMFIGMYAAVSREIKDMNIRTLALNTSSVIKYIDENGAEQDLEHINSDTNRIWVDSTQIPQVMKDAIVAIEDERFYNHNGVDFKRTFGATGKWILSKVGIGSASFGGSTITQQVIKNITNEKDNTPARKIKEIMRALALEKELSKDEILTMYLNIAYFANNCNGVEAAARTYFNKNAANLTLAEAASIAGITQFPSEFDPFVHPENNIEKRNLVLSKMLELGYINEADYAEASASDLVVSNAYRESADRITSYFVDQVINDVVNDLVEQKGYSNDFATRQVYNGGLTIYATVDPDIQKIMEDVFTDYSNFPTTGKGAQSAMVVSDPFTGQIKGLVGGLGEKTNIRGWNRATQMKRQPGSSIKPLSVYGPAIDTGKITEVTEVVDEEITIGDDKWKPKNAYSGFLGPMTVKEAISRSANIPAVKILDMLGVSTSFSYLRNKFHLTSIDEQDRNYSSLALGGLTQGVSVEEMAAAYGAFVNNGQYIKPHTYTRVLDAKGDTVLSNGSNTMQAISAASAFIMSDLLRGVVTGENGTGGSAQLPSMPTYGKTGTTDDDCDKWFVGFTPYYVGACWYGFDSPSSISAAGVYGNPAITAWRNVMSRIHENLNPKDIAKPSNVVEATVCAKSGMLPTSTCPSITGYFVEGTQPRAMCDSSHATKQQYTPAPNPSATSSASPSASVAVMTPSPTVASQTREHDNTTSGVTSGTSGTTSETSRSTSETGTSSSSTGRTSSESSSVSSSVSSSASSSSGSESSSSSSGSSSSSDSGGSSSSSSSSSSSESDSGNSDSGTSSDTEE